MEQGEAMGSLSYIFGKFAANGTVWIGGEATIIGQSLIDT